MDLITHLGAAASIFAVIRMNQSVGLLLRDLHKDSRHARADIESLYKPMVCVEIITKGLDDLAKRTCIEAFGIVGGTEWSPRDRFRRIKESQTEARCPN